MTATRKDELMRLILQHGGAEAETKAVRLVEEIVFVEEQLAEVKKLPFISVNPANPSKQKSTPAARLYRELSQRYSDNLKLLLRITGDIGGEKEGESPLREWLRGRKESGA